MKPSILGKDIKNNQPVIIHQEQRLRGLYVIGITGSGKTTLLVNMVLQDIDAGMGVCFITPHGDAITDILKRLPPYREQDVILLDPLDKTHAFGLNLLHCTDPTDAEEVSRVQDSVIEVFAKLFTETGDIIEEAPNMADTLQLALPVLLAHQFPPMTIAEIPLLTTNADARTKLLAPITHPAVKGFWEDYHTWKKDEQKNLTDSTNRRVRDFTLNPFLFEIIAQNTSTFDLRKIMDEQKILLVKLSREHKLITSLVGSVLVMQIANAAFSREDILEEDQRVQFNLYADEYQRFSTPTFAELLTEVRKFKIATCVAHQSRGQLDYKNRVATLNAGNLVVYEVSGEDAQELAGKFKITPQEAYEEELEEESVEVTKEEWFEPKIDVIEDGTEEIKTPIRDVLDYLSNRGLQDDPAVARFQNGLLREMEYAASQAVVTDLHGSGRLVYPRKGFPYELYIEYDPQKIRDTMVRLNTFFADAMRTKQQFLPLPEEIVVGFSHYFGFTTIAGATKGSSLHTTLLRVLLASDIDHTLRSEQYTLRQGAVEMAKNRLYEMLWERHIWPLLRDNGQENTYGILEPDGGMHFHELQYYYMPVIKSYHTVMQGMEKIVSAKIDQLHAEKKKLAPFDFYRTIFAMPSFVSFITTHAEVLAQEELVAFTSFIAELRKVAIALATKPIQTGSGLMQPRTRTQITYLTHPREIITHPRIAITHPQRTYADIREEIANNLARPAEPFTARAKVGTKEYTIQALPFSTPLPDWMARRDWIIQNTHNTYCRLRTEVREEIKQRQDALTRRDKKKPQATSDEDED